MAVQTTTESVSALIRQNFLSFHQPDIGQAEIDELVEILHSGWITTGPKTHQFEAEFAAFVGAKHGIAVNSCTAAMHLALEAVGLGRDDEVITSPYTFAATAEVVRYLDAKPVFVDVCPDDLNINPGLIEAAITKRTKAIIPVHIAGLPADLDPICAIAARHGLAVVEDAAHAFPAHYRGRMIGQSPEIKLTSLDTQLAARNLETVPNLPPAACSLPHATCFSFYATKTITTGEGGMLCTDNEGLAERCQIMALHGISKDAWKRYTAEGSWCYQIVAPGYKYNMTDLAAGMGLAQLRKAERMWQRRCEIAATYNQAFGDLPELQIPAERTDCQHAWHLYILRLNLERLHLDRAQFVEALKQLNIGVSVHFIPLHLHSYYRETYGYAPTDFPVAFEQFQRALSLPLYSKMSDTDVADVIAAVLELVGKYRIKTQFWPSQIPVAVVSKQKILRRR